MSQKSAEQKKPKVVLAAVQLPGVSDSEHASSLDELERLCGTLGFVTVGRVSQKRPAAANGSVLGEGKLIELASWTGGTGIIKGYVRPGDEVEDDEGLEELYAREAMDEPAVVTPAKAELAIFDCEITPNQLRNLEEALGVEVLDRSGVILEIFSRHARSREARLQVEIAKLAYLAPRRRAARTGGDRQGGGIGAKGAGESSHELDRRRIRDRIAELRHELDLIQGEQSKRRASRREAPCVALVGYTNAGKSSLMRALTHSEVLVENKLFATLDTTVRALQPETVPRILVSDTVGFIKKLPHDLVASFRSTLDEALGASLLLFTVDASDPSFRAQLQVTQTVLAEIGADQTERVMVMNKIDCLTPEQQKLLIEEYPKALFISTRDPRDVQRVREVILQFFERDMVEKTVLVPYSQGQLLGKVRERARVVDEIHEDTGTRVTIRAHDEVHAWFEKQMKQALPS